MGWKVSTILIKDPPQLNHQLLLQELGYESLTKVDDKSFESVMNPDDNKVYIGTYKNILLICSPDLPMNFFGEQKSATEETLIRRFPASEICAIILHSVVNLWGYSILKGGKKIRTRSGSSDDGTFIENGEPLPEEMELLQRSIMDKDGQRRYQMQDDDEEVLTEDQVGENFVFAISKRYFGEELDQADDDLFETVLTGYSYKQNTAEKEESVAKPKTKRWITYVILFTILLLWQILKRTVFKE